MKKNAFTMIELIFVIVILGILSSVAIPYFAGTQRTAALAAGKADIASIRASIISERQTRLVRGQNTYIPQLSDTTTLLFTGTGTATGVAAVDQNRTLLLYGIKAGSAQDGWITATAGANTYKFAVNTVQTTFTYTPADGKFSCTTDTDDCNALVD